MSGCLKQVTHGQEEFRPGNPRLPPVASYSSYYQERCLDISSEFHLQIFQHLHLACSTAESDKT